MFRIFFVGLLMAVFFLWFIDFLYRVIILVRKKSVFGILKLLQFDKVYLNWDSLTLLLLLHQQSVTIPKFATDKERQICSHTSLSTMSNPSHRKNKSWKYIGFVLKISGIVCKMGKQLHCLFFWHLKTYHGGYQINFSAPHHGEDETSKNCMCMTQW